MEEIRITEFVPATLLEALKSAYDELGGNLSGLSVDRWLKARGGIGHASPEARVVAAATYPMVWWLREQEACRRVPVFGEYIKHFVWSWNGYRARDERAFRELRRIFGPKPDSIRMKRGDSKFYFDQTFRVPTRRNKSASHVLPAEFRVSA